MNKSTLRAKNRIPRPKISGQYINIYVPKGSEYRGTCELFNKGQYYDTWIVNDHGFIKGEDGWHIFGITHPKPDDFINDYDSGDNIHSGEEQLFHAFGEGSFKELLISDSYEDCEKILYPDERSNEIPAIHAPHVIEWDGEYRLIYGPKQIRYAVSHNLFEFTPKGTMFEGMDSTRDPNVFIDDDNMVYILYARDNMVCYRTSTDLIEWSDEKILQVNPYKNGTSESPFMLKRNGIYYLFWCIWDQTCGSYDNRTFVFGNYTIEGLKDCSPLTILEAHAPEIIQDEDGDYYISSAFYPYNGVNVAPLTWE